MPAVRLGVLGGTFDPIHNGHLLAAQSAQTFLNLDRVLFIPAGDPWQKTTVASAQQRLEMTELAIAGNPSFSISSIDIDRAGPTYTVDTLTNLTTQFDGADLYFICGSDAFNGVSSWRDSHRLFELATFAVLERPGHPIDLTSAPASAVVVIPEEMPDTSSTECREMIAAGLLAEAPVPPAVADYIRTHNLYWSAA